MFITHQNSRILQKIQGVVSEPSDDFHVTLMIISFAPVKRWRRIDQEGR